MNRPARPAPYIGATGVVTPAEAYWAGFLLSRYCVTAPTHRPMLGVLASYRTLRGETVTNRRYPVIGDVRAILASMPAGVFRTIHFNTRGDVPLQVELTHLLGVCGVPDGIQLNVVRPDPNALAAFSRDFPQVEIILQVNGSSLGHDRSPQAVADYVARYSGIASHALLDLSGGNGRDLNVRWAAECIRLIEADPRSARIRVGVAGGLGPESFRVLSDLVAHVGHRTFSVDAEGRLRVPVADPIEGEPYQDQIEACLVNGYAEACVRTLRPLNSGNDQ